MMSRSLNYKEILQLAGSQEGAIDIACPDCGPGRRSPANRGRKVLRVWRVSPAFVTYRCARCDVHGHSREDGAPSPDPVQLAKARAEAQRFAATTAEAKRSKARWLYSTSLPPERTVVDRYLREVRRYDGPIPATIRFLPARGD